MRALHSERMMGAKKRSPQRHRLADRGNDCYETPPEAVRSLVRIERIPRRIWEPADQQDECRCPMCSGRGIDPAGSDDEYLAVPTDTVVPEPPR
jgi:hypothetical protein